MNFTPRSAAEIQESDLLLDGEYDYEVISAEDAVSKKGNEMIALTLRIHDGDGGQRTIRDWLVAGDASIRKVRGFAASCGMLAEYDTGQLDAMALPGRAGRCKIKTDRPSDFPPRNAVSYYVDASAASRHAPPAARRAPAMAEAAPSWDAPKGGGDIDDEIPF